MSAQTSYSRYTDAKFHGSLADLRDNEVVSKAAEEIIGVGIVVQDGTADSQAKKGGTYLGISIRDLAREAVSVSDFTVQYAIGTDVSILKRGAINLALASGGSKGDLLKYNTTTGVIDAGVAGGARTGAAVAGGGDTGDGVVGAITPGSAAIDGVYTLLCVAAAANAGTFSVVDPAGNRLDDLTVAVAYSNDHFAVTIADGAADFIVGDSFALTIAPTVAGEAQIPGATLEETVTAGVVASCRISGQNA